jgi:hypothetical protein
MKSVTKRFYTFAKWAKELELIKILLPGVCGRRIVSGLGV